MKKIGLWKRIGSVALAAALMLGNLSGISLPVRAETAVYGGMGVKTADLPTVNGWEAIYGEPGSANNDRIETSYAGGVWTDKSVFESAETYFAATSEQEQFSMELENPRNFLLSLSAIASTKTIVGHSTLPIDTMFVLDVSGSMDDSNRDSRMVAAANKAIGDLLALNNYNRVGVVLYSSDATVVMPLDRYTTTSTTTLNNQTIPSYIYLSSDDRVTISSGVRNSDNSFPNGSREVTGGTYIQSGIYTAALELTDPDLDTVITEGFQRGTTRTPIMVLMTDGEPTYGVNSYTQVGTRNMGSGSSSNADLTFMTQLTASWAKAKIAQKYGEETEPLFYTLGLAVSNTPLALSVMDPMHANGSSEVNAYWTTFNGAEEGAEIRLNNSSYTEWEQNDRGRWEQVTRYRTVTKLNDGVSDGNDTLPLRQDYVDQYFPASNSNDLSTAFQSIVDTIVIQTMYYPTLVEGGDVHHGGYLEFRDYIGPNMEVKQVEGIQLGDSLYTGENFAKLVATGMGTEDRPTEAGNELVWSMITRLQLGETDDPAAVETVRDLLEDAWSAGQLAYNVDYDGNVTWSNWVGWYADADNKYLGFWDGGEIAEEMIGRAAYAVKSYLVIGGVGEGHRETDMLYASIQVRSALDEKGDVIEDIVYGRLPAALIPIVEYNVELNSNDPATATEITLTKTGATAPIRLLYEVGLRSEIDLLNMEGTAVEDLKTDSDGNYIFYTNQWDIAGLEEGNHPNKLHNTYVNFFPSEENERYYYHEDTPIYTQTAGGAYELHSGAKPAAGDGTTYYRALPVYSAQTNGGSAVCEIHYREIPAQALTDETVVWQESTNQWVVKKGTLRLYTARTAVQKTENLTDTLPYSEYPIVHDDAAIGYHLDGILGNNGLLTIDAPEGLKLTKRIDETLTDQGQTYTFTVELTRGSHDGAGIYLITETDGVRSGWQQIDFEDAFTVELAAGDSAWLAGLPEGNEYTVTETDGEAYEVSAVTVDGIAVDEAVVTIRKNHIASVEVTNSAVFTGDISLGKHVVSPYAPHETDAYGFSFEVTLTGAEAGETYATELVAADGSKSAGEDITADDNGEAAFAVELSHGEKVVILGLPEGAAVTAKETQLPGFTSNQTNDTATALVVVGEVTNLEFVNTYEPAPVSPANTVDVYAKKILKGRDWEEGDSFTFHLEKHISKEEHDLIEEISVGYDDADKVADFQSNVNDLFETAGTYSYRITEEHGDLAGMAYDSAICYFDIVVEDDGEGSLYIADVIGRQDVTVTHDETGNTWDVTAEFTNVYTSSGSVQLSLGVEKDVKDPAGTGIDKSGFVFEVYSADEEFNIGDTPDATVETNAEGVATFHDTLITREGSYHFVLKEAQGDRHGMRYDETVYYAAVEVTSDPSTSGLVATGTMVDGAGNELYRETVEYDPAAGTVPALNFAAFFTNIYTPDEADTAIAGTKTLTGRDLRDGEFTFVLYEADLTDTGFVVGDYITEVSNTGDIFVFEDLDALTYDAAGYYYYAVMEEEGSQGGVTYDEKTVFVTVHVTADLENNTLVINSVDTTDAAGINLSLQFDNTYAPGGTSAEIGVSKEMTGTRALAADMFQFYLYETGKDYAVSGEAVQTVTNDADGNVTFALDYTEAGEYYYVVAERIPANLDADGRLNGVYFDQASFRVKVEVTDDLDGSLVADVTYVDSAPVFVNDYTPAPVTAQLSGYKTLSGRNQAAGEFAFELYETDSHFVPLDDTAEDTAANVDLGDGTFGFTFAERTYTEAGGYRYIIVEKNTGSAQIDYDTTVFYVLVSVTDNGAGQLVSQVSVGSALDAEGRISVPVTAMEFFNVFTHRPAKLTISGEKTLEGHEWLHNEKVHQFAFELYEADADFAVAEGAVPLTAVNDPDAEGQEGAFSFAEMTFTETGTYYYVAKERLPEGVSTEYPLDETTRILYDTAERHVTVTVQVDENDPEALKATYTVDGAETLAFRNVYIQPVPLTISGTKTLSGRTIVDGEFTFELYRTAADFMVADDAAPVDTTTNVGNDFTFAVQELPEAGVYYYAVREARGNAAYVTYDTTVYHVTVTVSSNGTALEQTVEYKVGDTVKTGIEFRNAYRKPDPQPDPMDVELTVEKIVKGSYDRGAEGFVFELLDQNGDAVDTARSDHRGEAVLDAGTFRKSDAGKTFTFYIREVDTGITGMTYSTREYKVQITVVYDSSRNRLSYELHKDGVPVDKDEPFAFTNLYYPGKEPVVSPESPKTGDDGVIGWISMLTVCALGLAVTLFVMAADRRKRA